MSGWVMLAPEGQGDDVRSYLRASGGEVASLADPWELRRRLGGDLAGLGVVVCEGACGPDAVNVAAALVKDGHAKEVCLYVRHASGSLRSRAKRAGIARILTADDLAARGASLSEAKGAQVKDGSPRAAGHHLRRRAEASVLCFVSGRGGVGKSTVCALSAHIAASWGMRVAVLDLDLAFGNLYALCGAEGPVDLAGLANGEGLEASRVCARGREVAPGVRLWGPCAQPEYAELVFPMAADIIAALTQQSDLVLIDTSTSWGDAVACAAQQADRLVIVSDERPGAVASLSRCGSLAVRLGVARTKIVRLMNGCDPKGRDESFVARAAQGLECAREVRVMDGGDEAIEMLSGGHARELSACDSPLVASLSTGLAQVLRELGCLPDTKLAARALEGRRRPRGLLGRGKEVA